MKKAMFNDRYGLTESVLDGSKTIMRIMIKEPARTSVFVKSGIETIHGYEIKPKYQVGEIVAVAQSYRKMAEEVMTEEEIREAEIEGRIWSSSAGWNNKMFVKADLMPYRIQITNIRIEKLQDISDEDCIKEGINIGCEPMRKGKHFYYYDDNNKDERLCFNSPREAYASLIDEISGKGVWKSNPYVFVYEFKLVK